MTRFPEQRIVITGAASGLGRATALRFARAGWRVAIADIDAAGMDATLAAVREAGSDGLTERCDVTCEDDWRRLRQRLEADWGGVDVLVNNAGVAAAGSVVDSAWSDWTRLVDINLLGVTRGCRALVPLMLAEGRGHVVNIASFAGIACAPGMAPYNVVKAGVIALSESLRCETADRGVAVSVACPAFFPTNLADSMHGSDPVAIQFTERAMHHSGVTADDVAGDIFKAVEHGRFMVISHKDSRMQWRLKRVAPETFHKLVRRRVRRAMARIAARATD